MVSKQTKQAALGSILGACVGDAAGATLEFMGRKPTEEEVKSALQMIGGGCFGLASGQITDDGELTLCLARALAESPSYYPIEKVATYYAQWFLSPPFDIGFTTRSAFEQAARLFRENKNVGIADTMYRSSEQFNMGSKANGSLMRATPIGVWAYNCTVEEIAEIAHQDSELTHPNSACGDAVTCYCIAIASLVKNPGNRELAWEQAANWASDHADEEVKSWIDLINDHVEVSCHPQAGFIKIAFTHAFRHLIIGSDFETALHETLLGGGDTDTNACIVGGLIGAVVGAENIPQHQRDAILKCDATQGRDRPEFFRTNDLEVVVERILHQAGLSELF